MLTHAVREAFQRVLDRHGDSLPDWVAQIEDPAERCNVVVRMSEFLAPKPQRVEIAAAPRVAPEHELSPDEAASIYRDVMSGSIDISTLRLQRLPARVPTTIDQAPAPTAAADPIPPKASNAAQWQDLGK